ncbi:helix-turn-helix domain-containing protein [Burkholderia cepacia]|uniref:helix-turn-helix domain-containing protein n=1 Tax=Burkholderia cepacia TaxID=292 RepID=UPI003EE2BC5A
MHPADIKAALEKAGYTQADVARMVGVSSALVAHVIHSRGSARRTAECISSLTRIPLAVLWPKLYGERKRPGGAA